MTSGIGAMIDALEDGQGLLIEEEGPGTTAVITLTMAELARIIDDPARATAYGLLHRPGVPRFQRYLELVRFPPGTEANRLLTAILWKGTGMLWAFTIIPLESEPWIHEAAGQCGLVAKRGLQAMVLGHEIDEGTMPATANPWAFARGFVQPDLPLERAWYLENVPGHLVYTDPKAAMAAEFKALQELEWAYG
jgi:hypothetical protein